MLPWLLCCFLSVAVVLLLIKILLMKKSMNEIRTELAEHLSTETNTLVSVSSGDKQIRHLVADLNIQLRLLRKQRGQYLSGNRELRDAVTNISHDLRTPLTAISGYLELLHIKEHSVETKRYLEIIGGRVEELKQLTQELFRYSVIIATKEAYTAEPTSIGEVLEESVAAFYTTLTERQITPDIKLPETEVIRNLDRAALSRIFSNLLSNAVKYSDGDLEISLSAKGEISFVNTASKLDTVQIGRLFDRFYTVENARKSTGLGLAISQVLVEQMKGTISAEYKDQKLCIRVFLPDVI